jgi:hypothetical protein
MKSAGSPALASWIMESVLPATSQSAMLGDLIEEYGTRSELGHSWAARLWFWSQTARSVSFLTWSILKSPSPGSIGVAAIVYLVMMSLKIGAGVLLSRLGTRPLAELIISPVVFLAITGVGGCLAARLRRPATIFLSLMVSVTVGILVAIDWCRITVPWWYQFGFFVAGPINVLIAPAIVWRPVRSRRGIAG